MLISAGFSLSAKANEITKPQLNLQNIVTGQQTNLNLDYFMGLAHHVPQAVEKVQATVQKQSPEAEKAAVQEQINDWHLWAEYLCDMPALAGFPWDGGFAATPWPEQPVLAAE